MMPVLRKTQKEKATSADAAFLCHHATQPEHIPAGGRLLLLAQIAANDSQVAVAEGVVVNVRVVCTGSASFDASSVTSARGDEARGIVRLVQVGESGRDVAEFSDNCTLQCNEANDHSENQDGSNENDFC